jgi:prepilin-type N-terminal cleavage/methylation domain-containing protein
MGWRTLGRLMTQPSFIPLLRSKLPVRAFTLVEIMVVVVIIGLLAALGLPTLRRVTLRSKASAVQNDLRTFSTAFITYNLQNAKWPADAAPGEIPPEMASALTNNFTLKTPIGGYYKWNYDVSADGITAKAAIVIEGDASNPLSDDADLRLMIDQQMDDGVLDTGNLQVGSTNSLVYIIEK